MPSESDESWHTYASLEESIRALRGGVPGWNSWIARYHHKTFEPKIEATPSLWANLRHADLQNAMLDDVDFRRIGLQGANLAEASMINALLTDSHAERVNFSKAVLRNVDFDHTWLNGAQLDQADCRHARFGFSDYRGVSFDRANLQMARFNSVTFSEVSMHDVHVERTSFIDCDLSGVSGSESWFHAGPSYLDLSTLLRSYRALSEAFLRRIGIPEVVLTYLPSLLAEPIQFYSCFISHSSADSHFADRLYADLQANGVRCWYAPKSMKIGDRLRDTIEQSIRIYDKLIVILSRDSVNSDWVEAEVENALERERNRIQNDAGLGRPTILIPIALDDAVHITERAWARTIRRQRHIGDFASWTDPEFYSKSLERLLRDIRSG